MVGYTFIGVFSGSAPNKKATPTGEPALWNVYLKNGEKNYLIQKLDEDNIVTKEQYQIPSIYFGINFRKVKNPNSKLEVNRNINKLTNKDEKNSGLNPEQTKNAYNALIKQKQEEAKNAELQKTQEKQIAQLQQKIAQEKQEEIPVQQQNNKQQEKTESKKTSSSPQDYKINLNSKYISKEEKYAPKTAQKKQEGKTSFSLSLSPANVNHTIKTNKIEEKTKESDQNPYDDKYSPEKHSLNAVLKKVEKAQRESVNKKLIPIKSSYKTTVSPIDKFQTTTLLENNSNEADEPFAITIEDEPFGITIEDVITDAETTNPTVNNVIQANTNESFEPEHHFTEKEIIKQNAGEELLLAKGSRSTNNLSDKAKRLDNQTRAEFQQSLNHWNSFKRNLAMKQFHGIVNKEANFVPAHKHMFTDFAIQLRKLNLHDLALSAAIRCTKLSPDDSHAFFNVSRLYFELNRFEQANEFIDKTLELENDLVPAKKLSVIIKECLRRKARNR